MDVMEALDFFGARYHEGWGYNWSDEVPVYCPFCEDLNSHKPAGRVNVMKDVYYCHACGAGGNAHTLFDRFTTIEVLEDG